MFISTTSSAEDDEEAMLIFLEIRTYGQSSDGNHVTAPTFLNLCVACLPERLGDADYTLTPSNYRRQERLFLISTTSSAGNDDFFGFLQYQCNELSSKWYNSADNDDDNEKSVGSRRHRRRERRGKDQHKSGNAGV